LHIYDNITLNSSYNERYVKNKVLEKIKTHILYPIFFFSTEIMPFF
jgi:hypothetical protein